MSASALFSGICSVKNLTIVPRPVPPQRKEYRLNNQPFQRVTIYHPGQTDSDRSSRFEAFKLNTGNAGFSRSGWTYFSLVILLLVYPVISLLGVSEDPTLMLKSLNQGTLMLMLIVTILMQWSIFLVNYVSTYFENTGLAGVGLKRIRMVDFAWGGAFFLFAMTLLTGLAWVLAQIGLPMPGEIGLLIPTDPFGRVIWVLVSFTAGFCEEIAFRGYLMTRLRLLGKARSWLIPTAISAIAFGIGHAYQGVPGLIVITIYGVLFSLLYIRTGSLWPCIIAHSLQDLSALFMPQ